MIHPILKISEYDIESVLIIVLILAPECFFIDLYFNICFDFKCINKGLTWYVLLISMAKMSAWVDYSALPSFDKK